MRTAVVLFALLALSAYAYDFSKPESGDELRATLKDEKNTTFVIFFHAPEYEGEDEDETKKIQDMVKDMKEDVQKNCTSAGLKDSDYTYVDVEIELEGTKEKEAEKGFGTLL